MYWLLHSNPPVTTCTEVFSLSQDVSACHVTVTVLSLLQRRVRSALQSQLFFRFKQPCQQQMLIRMTIGIAHYLCHIQGAKGREVEVLKSGSLTKSRKYCARWWSHEQQQELISSCLSRLLHTQHLPFIPVKSYEWCITLKKGNRFWIWQAFLRFLFCCQFKHVAISNIPHV